MAFHHNQAQFEWARWRGAFVIPIWGLQIAMLLGLVGIFSYRLSNTAKHSKDNDKKGKEPVVEFVWEAINITFSLLSLIVTTIEILKFFAETLTPFYMLASHTIKLTCALAILALDIMVYTLRSGGNWSIVGLAIDAGLLASMLILCIYSMVTFRRVLEVDDYHHPASVKAFGFGSSYKEIEMGDVSGADAFLRASPYNDVSTDYSSQTRGISGARSRSFSDTSSLHRIASISSEFKSGLEPPGPHPAEMLDDTRGESYNHERNTNFDEYLTRASLLPRKGGINQATGKEPWRSAGGRTPLGRSGSIGKSGAVGSKAIRPRPDPMNRTVS